METSIKSLNFNQIKVSNAPTLKTGNEKFDEWFSKKGGMVLRSAVYVSGTSGAGKTTLMVNMMNWLKDVTTCMYEREVEAQDVYEPDVHLIRKRLASDSSLRRVSPTHFAGSQSESLIDPLGLPANLRKTSPYG